MELEEIARALEAVLFAAGDSVEIQRIAQVLGEDPARVSAAAEALREEYEKGRRGFRLAVMDGRLQLATAPEHSETVQRVLEKGSQPRLSPTALEVLSIVAYYQPVTRAYIEQLRGTDSSYTVALLSQRGLIAPCGRLEARAGGAVRHHGAVFAGDGPVIFEGTAPAAGRSHRRGNAGAAGCH